KAFSYRNYYRDGAFAQRHNRPRSDYKKLPFRVLFIVKSAERRDNFARLLLTLTTPIYSQAWLATLEDVLDDPFGRVWITPRDFAQAATRSERSGTSHSATPSRRSSPALADGRLLTKRSLFD